MPESHLLIVAGDFNARLPRRHAALRRHLGPGILPDPATEAGQDTAEVEDNRNRFMDWVMQSDMAVASTRRQYPARQLVTFRPAQTLAGEPPYAGGRYQHIDHILVRRRWVNAVRPMGRDARCGVESDHWPVGASVQIRFAARPRRSAILPGPDWGAMTDTQYEEYNTVIARRAAEGPVGMQAWAITLEEAADKSAPTQPPHRRSHYLSAATWAMILGRHPCTLR